MSSKLEIQCDRCGKLVDGEINEIDGNKVTTGFYNVTEGYWSQFAHWEESNICDKCMHSDINYKKMYGK